MVPLGGGAPMRTVAILTAVLMLAGAEQARAAGRRKGGGGGGGGDSGDPNHAVAKAHAGRVWVRADAFPTSEGARLSAWLGQHAPKGEVTAKAKEAPWAINYLAVFKKPAVK